MTTGELCQLLQTVSPALWFPCSRNWGHRAVGIYCDDTHVDSMGCGTLPPRTIRDANGTIVCRGWRDVVASLYKDGYLPHARYHKELVRLMGIRAFDIIDRTGSPFLPQDVDWPGVVDLPTVPKKDWMNEAMQDVDQRAQA